MGQAETVQKFVDKAYELSAIASDSGAYAFSAHAGYDKALKDNSAATKAWQVAHGAARSSGMQDVVSDSENYIAQLKQAYQMLLDQKKERGKAAWDAGWGGALTAAAAKAKANRSAQRTAPGRAAYSAPSPAGAAVKKWGVLAAVGAIAAKLAGLW